MNEKIAIDNIQSILIRDEKQRRLPTILQWNRLEVRPRSKDFDRALQAEIRDALWMLTKQWQIGEFKADDAGSPIMAKMHMTTTQLTKFQPGNHSAQPFDSDVPLETQVEKRPISFTLDIRLLMGRHWLKLLSKAKLTHLRDKFIKKYRIETPKPKKSADLEESPDAQICAHLVAWQKFSAAAGRLMDGENFYRKLTQSKPADFYNDITAEQDEISTLENLEKMFTKWFHALFYQPINPDPSAWLPERLEYQFSCSAPVENNEKILNAEEYYHGHLDWYNFSVDQSRITLGSVNVKESNNVQNDITRSFIPAPVRFEGMPHTRWWRFEDGKTNFGDIKPDTTDINKLMLIEFGLIYANDWFLLPVTLPTGSLCDIKGLVVSNVFGERFWIEASAKGQDEDPQRWVMYAMNIAGQANVPADLNILVAPAVPKILEGDPVEEINLIRDEVANMVWGLETRIQLQSGDSKSGREAALQLAQYYQSSTIPSPDAVAAFRYQLMNSIPENWIPFIPVHKDNDRREIQLQRASMPRVKPIGKIKPRTALLREGLSENPPRPYFIHEEEVPRSGAVVTQSFQRTRWYDGKVITWLGARKQTGRGEGASGLAFDLIVPTKK